MQQYHRAQKYTMTPEDLSTMWENKKTSMSVYDWLHFIGLYHKIVPRDSNSLFRAVSENLFGTQRCYGIVRKECAFYLKLTNNSLNLPVEVSIEEYSEKILSESVPGGFNEIALMSHFYRRDFIIIDSKKGPIFDHYHGFGTSIYLYFIQDQNHFDILLPLEIVEKVSYCQSLVYEILCVNVMKLKNFVLGDKFFSNKSSNDYFVGNKENSMIEIRTDDDSNKTNSKYQKSVINSKIFSCSNPNVKKTGFAKRYQLPHRIFKGISPMIYKNVEYDSWIELKKEKEISATFHDGIMLQVGVKCLCKIEPNQTSPYTCYIQVMTTDNKCLVYIEELGEKRTVNISQLMSLPANEAKSWYTRKRFHMKQYINKSTNELVLSVNSKPKKGNMKYKKSNGIVQEFENIVDSKKRDTNNNSLTTKTEIISSSISSIGWNNKNVDDVTLNNIKCLEKYTREDFYTFTPQAVEYITMPLTTETNGNFRENSLNRQNSHFYPTNTIVTTCNSPCVSFTQTSNSSEPSGINTPIYTNASTPSSSSSAPPPGNGNYTGSNSPNYPSYPFYCVPSGGFQNVRPTSVFPMHYRSPVPLGVNFNIQRSLNPNGSDLPYNDVATLRYFFNLGIEYMQSGGVVLPQLPLSLPPMAPMPNTSYYYQTTPNQLALEMQNSLSLEDSSNISTSSNNPKQNKFNDYRGGRGGHSRFKRNDAPNDRNGKNCPNFNRNHFNNQRKPRNFNYHSNNKTPDNDKKETENESAIIESPATSNPLTHYPPPYYRHASYSFENPQYVPQNYIIGSEDSSIPPEDSGYIPPPGGAFPHQYMTYIPPPPPPYFYASPNGPNYYVGNFNTPTSAENQPLQKN